MSDEIEPLDSVLGRTIWELEQDARFFKLDYKWSNAFKYLKRYAALTPQPSQNAVDIGALRERIKLLEEQIGLAKGCRSTYSDCNCNTEIEWIKP